jgi:hypothetical protein
MLVMARMLQILAFGSILACYYTRLGSDQNSIQDRLGLIQQCTALLFVGILNNIAVFPDERNVFYREFTDGSYTTLPFFLSYSIYEIIFELIASFGFSALLIYLIGMQDQFEIYIMCMYCVFMTVNGNKQTNKQHTTKKKKKKLLLQVFIFVCVVVNIMLLILFFVVFCFFSW